MFNLSDRDLCRSILGCSDGPAGFNAHMHALGHPVISCDPLYQYSHDQIGCSIRAARDEVMQQVRENPQNFTWNHIRTPSELEQVRMTAMQSFLADYEAGLMQGRYIAGALPRLPFRDQSFDLGLCSHFLFLYNSLGQEFHLRSIREMARVAREVRIYPVVNTNGERAEFFEELLCRIRSSGLGARTEPAGYDFLKNGGEMLRITGE
ncbi:hypothetical protein [uncultured Methanoregula sp.]|uniref:hypothetical protein n=1 Tax=uncultured Methanoregula sp. TaxID=1005933 RepID=UPI002AAAB75A|nr:hypothetical protein [uncultured Methanoregula sp.]